jgi:hypothetical protein
MKKKPPPKVPQTAEELQALLLKHLQPAIQHLQRAGAEVVIIGVARDDPPDGVVGIAGTVQPHQVRALVAAAHRELEKDFRGVDVAHSTAPLFGDIAITWAPGPAGPTRLTLLKPRKPS